MRCWPRWEPRCGVLRLLRSEFLGRRDGALANGLPGRQQFAPGALRLAWDGRTSPEISTRLFISPRPAGWHLRTVFAKLGISSRKELRQALPDLAEVAVPA